MKVKSSSLVEVIVSMVIFSIIMGIVVTLVFRYNGRKNDLKIQARQLLNFEIAKSKESLNFIDLSYDKNGFEIEQLVEVYDESLILFRLRAKRNDKLPRNFQTKHQKHICFLLRKYFSEKEEDEAR